MINIRKTILSVFFIVSLILSFTSIKNGIGLDEGNIVTSEIILSEWPRIYDGGDNDTAWGIAVDSQGNIIVAGTSYDSSTNNFHIIKYDSEGNELWNITYDSGIDDEATDVTVDSEDNIIVIGFTGRGVFDEGYYHIIKYDENGRRLWDKFYKLGDLSVPFGITVDSEDNIIATGVRLKYGFGGIELPCWTIKVDRNGDMLWNKTFQIGIEDEGLSVVVDREGNILVVGVSVSFYQYASFTVKYDRYGNEIWSKRFANDSAAYDIAVDSKNNIVVAGSNLSNRANPDYYILKLNENGDEIWTRRFDSGGPDYAYAIKVDSDNNVIIGGSSQFRHCILIYDKNGKELLIKKPQVNGSIMDIAINNKMIYTTGWIEGKNSDYYTTRYSDMNPPVINIIKPEENSLYIFDKKIIPLSRNTIILGGITIEVDISNQSDVYKIEFYIDNSLEETIYKPPYSWVWNKPTIGQHWMRVLAYDKEGNIGFDKEKMWVFII